MAPLVDFSSFGAGEQRKGKPLVDFSSFQKKESLWGKIKKWVGKEIERTKASNIAKKAENLPFQSPEQEHPEQAQAVTGLLAPFFPLLAAGEVAGEALGKVRERKVQPKIEEEQKKFEDLEYALKHREKPSLEEIKAGLLRIGETVLPFVGAGMGTKFGIAEKAAKAVAEDRAIAQVDRAIAREKMVKGKKAIYAKTKQTALPAPKEIKKPSLRQIVEEVKKMGAKDVQVTPEVKLVREGKEIKVKTELPGTIGARAGKAPPPAPPVPPLKALPAPKEELATRLKPIAVPKVMPKITAPKEVKALPAPKEIKPTTAEIKAGVEKIKAGQKSATIKPGVRVIKKGEEIQVKTKLPAGESTISIQGKPVILPENLINPMKRPEIKASELHRQIDESIAEAKKLQAEAMPKPVVEIPLRPGEYAAKPIAGKELIKPVEKPLPEKLKQIQAEVKRIKEKPAKIPKLTEAQERAKSEIERMDEEPFEALAPMVKPKPIESAKVLQKPGWIERFWREFIAPEKSTIIRMGEPGKQLIKKLDDAKFYEESTKGSAKFETMQAMEKLSPQELDNMTSALNEGIAPINDRVKNAVTVVDKWRNFFAEKAQEAKLKIKTPSGELRDWSPRKDYFPHYFPEKMSPYNLQEIISKGGKNKEELLSDLVGKGYGKDTAEAETMLQDWLDRVAKRKIEEGTLKKGEAAMGQAEPHLETARLPHEPPGWERDPRKVLPQYYGDAARRVSEAQYFGPNDEKLEPLYEEITKLYGKNRSDWAKQRIQTELERIKGADDPLATARALNVTSSMAFSAIPNMAQKINAVLTHGIKAAAKGAKTYKTPEGLEMAARSGVLEGNITKEMGDTGKGATKRLADFFLNVHKFSGTESGNNAFSANTVVPYLDNKVSDLFKRFEQVRKTPTSPIARKFYDNVRKDLEELNINPDEVLKRQNLSPEDYNTATSKIIKDLPNAQKLTQEELNRAMWQSGGGEQFRGTNLATPRFWDDPEAKTALQFQRFQYYQARLITSTVLKEAKKGNLAPLAILATVFPVAGEVIGDIQSLISGNKRPTGAWERYVDNLGNAAAFGSYQSAAESAEYGEAGIAKKLLGPTFQKAITVGYKIPKRIIEATTGKKPLEPKDILLPLSVLPFGQIPATILKKTGVIPESPYWKKKGKKGWKSTAESLQDMINSIKKMTSK